MFGALKTVEDHNLYASFGLIDNLEENELQDINGGWCACDGLSITFTITTGANTTGSNNGVRARRFQPHLSSAEIAKS